MKLAAVFSCAPRERLRAQPPRAPNAPPGQGVQPRGPDAIAEAPTPQAVANVRPEQRKTAHDLSDIFGANAAPPTSAALADQIDHGQCTAFDFYLDPLGATRPPQPVEELVQPRYTALPR